MSEDKFELSASREDVVDWVDSHGDVLFRYALSRVGQRDIAEDLVQETFVSALRGLKDFQGRSAVRTWLVAILRNRIVDHLRQATRRRAADSRLRDDETTQFFHNGHWQTPVKHWPTSPMESQEFWQAVDDCQDQLPVTLESAFRMRDVEQLPTAEICELLEISRGNLSVRLHRARLLLRNCLERSWFS